MALGSLVMEEAGQVTGVRPLSTDESGAKAEISLELSGTIRGVAETTTWTYTTLTRSDGSIYGWGEGVMTTTDGDVIKLIGHGSAVTPAAGAKTLFRTMLHPYSESPKYADLNGIGLVGEYEIAADGRAANKNWEWK